MRPSFPGAPVVAETRTLPPDVLGNGRSLRRLKQASNRRVGGALRVHPAPTARRAGRRVLPGICFASRLPQGAAIWSSMPTPMPAFTRSRRDLDNKGQSHKGAVVGDGESHRDEL